MDGTSNAYVTGPTGSSNFPTQNPYQGTYGGGGIDAFVTELKVAGSALLYSTYLGGSDDDWPYSTAVDEASNAYVTGYTHSTDFPTQNPYQEAYGGGSYDAFVTKLSVLSVRKSAMPNPVRVGAQLTYNIWVTNTGDVDLHATVTDTLPTHVTPSGVLTWTPTITAFGGVWTEQFTVTVEMDYAGTLTNVVRVTTEEDPTGVYTETSVSKYMIYLPTILKSY